MLKVEWLPTTGSLSEIYQSTQMQFAFLSSPKDGSKQCHPFVLCRDFLHDAARCVLQKNSCQIYGFRYAHGENPPVDMKKMRMMVTKKNMKKVDENTFLERMKHGLKIVQHYETIADWTKSKLVRIKDDKYPNVWLFVGPSGWMKSPFLISMYTFLIRLGDKYETISKFNTTEELVQKLEEISKLKKKDGDNDITYIKQCFDKMHLIMEQVDNLFLSNGTAKQDPIYTSDEIGLDSFHNYCGIWNLCKATSPDKELNKKILALK